ALVSEPQKLRDRIRKLFGLVRASLAEELNGGGTGNGHAAPAADGTPEANRRGAASIPSRPDEPGGTSPRPATPAQVKALYAIARARETDLARFLQERFQARRPSDLSITQAS